MPLRNNPKGFTLIELLVVIGIMALMMGVAVGFIGNSFSSQVRKQSSHLIAVIRYAYNQATVTGNAYRLVFDLSEQAYWLEEGPEKVVVKVETEDSEDSEKSDDSGQPDESEPSEESGDSEDSDKKPVSDFTVVDSDTVKKVQLGGEVFIRDVYAAHQTGLIEDGTAYLYFFPSGMTEFAVIHLSNEAQDKNYSLIVNPATGGVKVEADYIEHESLLEK